MTLAFIRDHNRKVTEYKRLIEESPPPPDGQPRGSGTGNPTQRTGIRRAELKTAIDAVNDALEKVPEEYRKGVWENIVEYKKYPDDAGRATYARHKQRFIYWVAEKRFYF